MAYVEESAPDESIHNCLEHLIFTIPNNWNPPMDFENETKPPDPETSHKCKEEEREEEFTICYVQEEVSGSGDKTTNPTRGPHPETTIQ